MCITQIRGRLLQLREKASYLFTKEINDNLVAMMYETFENKEWKNDYSKKSSFNCCFR